MQRSFSIATFSAFLVCTMDLGRSAMQIYLLSPLVSVSRLIVLLDVCEEQRGDP